MTEDMLEYGQFQVQAAQLNITRQVDKRSEDNHLRILLKGKIPY